MNSAIKFDTPSEENKLWRFPTSLLVLLNGIFFLVTGVFVSAVSVVVLAL